MTEQVKQAIDVISIGTTLATIAGLLPAIAALVSLIWSCIRIYETKTVQRWLRGSTFERRGRK